MPTQGLFIKAGAGYSVLSVDDGISTADDLASACLVAWATTSSGKEAVDHSGRE